MKILVIIYFIVSIITFIFAYLMALSIIKKIKKEYPSVKFYKKSLIEKILALLRTLIISFCPIINLIVLLCLVFGYDKIFEAVEETIYENDIETLE